MSVYSKFSQADLPTARQLRRSTIIAFAFAVFVLVAVVYPSEYGIDPTGIGSWLGLTKMGQIKATLADEARNETRADAVGAQSPPAEGVGATVGRKSDSMTITLSPGEAAEVKLFMAKGAKAMFQWSSDGPINVDSHGEPPDAPKGFYHGYGKARQITGENGVIQAAFDGKHGWFWRNRSEGDVTLRLVTQGEYQEIKRLL